MGPQAGDQLAEQVVQHGGLARAGRTGEVDPFGQVAHGQPEGPAFAVAEEHRTVRRCPAGGQAGQPGGGVGGIGRVQRHGNPPPFRKHHRESPSESLSEGPSPSPSSSAAEPPSGPKLPMESALPAEVSDTPPSGPKLSERASAPSAARPSAAPVCSETAAPGAAASGAGLPAWPCSSA